MESIMHKAFCVVRSCRTLDQLLAAERFVNLALRRCPDSKFRERCERAMRVRFHCIKRDMQLEWNSVSRKVEF